ncbi:Winged helix-like DNA-binding domain superfamily [Sesbania bispinosa]|nr:Winged helix-like DNA-binding domain superfamily [Sesbania bispinosa]
MDPLEALAAQIQGLSSSPGDIARLHTILKQADDSLRAESTRLFPLLTQLHPSNHSLGFLYVLEAFTSTPFSKDQAETVMPVMTGFINACIAEQIRLAPEKFILVCKRLKELVMLLEAPIRGVAPLLTAVRKLQLSTEHLTPLHSEFLLLCLLAKCYKTGLSLLEDGVFEIEQPRDLFLYCYYGGMICIGQKNFHKALDLLHNVVTAPMSAMNAIAVEAYKKYILVYLIHHGQWQSSTSLPKYASSSAQRNLKNLCQDNNLGLVKQVVSSMYKRNIQRLTQTYLTLSLQDIASTVQLNSSKEAEMHVLQMVIQDGEIYATINQRDGMVRFLEDPEQYKTCEMIEHIDSSIQS